jgi:hypothetical protein
MEYEGYDIMWVKVMNMLSPLFNTNNRNKHNETKGI